MCVSPETHAVGPIRPVSDILMAGGGLVVIKFLEAIPQITSVATNVINRASARADTQMTHRKESNTESGHNTKWLITANGPLQS